MILIQQEWGDDKSSSQTFLAIIPVISRFWKKKTKKTRKCGHVMQHPAMIWRECDYAEHAAVSECKRVIRTYICK